MTDKTEHEIRRGEHAATLLNDELLQEVFATMKQEYMTKWLDSPERDVEGRERLRMMVKLLDKLRGDLAMVLETGKFAKLSLAQEIGERLKRAF